MDTILGLLKSCPHLTQRKIHFLGPFSQVLCCNYSAPASELAVKVPTRMFNGNLDRVWIRIWNCISGDAVAQIERWQYFIEALSSSEIYKALDLCVLPKNIGKQGGFPWVSSQNEVKCFSLKKITFIFLYLFCFSHKKVLHLFLLRSVFLFLSFTERILRRLTGIWRQRCLQEHGINKLKLIPEI